MLDQTLARTTSHDTNLNTASASLPVVLILGDGIGPEVSKSAKAVISAACPQIDWIEADAGAATMAKGVDTGLPADTLSAVERTGVVLKGPLATPIGYGGKSANVTLRKMFELYGNIRPIRTLPGVEGPYRGRSIDFTVVRENVEDLYAGIEHMQTPEVAQCLKLITRHGSEKIARLAFALAQAEGRGTVICATKSNIMKLTEGLFQRSFEAVAAEQSSVRSHHMIVDNCAQQMVLHPEQFEMVVTSNMNGDILSDLAAGLVGGLGLAPSANIGDAAAVFEAVHGSAPDIAGKGRANPTAMILSGAMMLRHLGQETAAARVETAVRVVYANGRDLPQDVARRGKSGSTEAFTDQVLAVLDTLPNYVEGPATMQLVPKAKPVAVATSAPLQRKFDGVDIFVEWHRDVQELAQKMQAATLVGGFRLSMISNRGTVVWPNGAKHTHEVPHWRCRFTVAEDDQDAESEVSWLLSVIGERIRWMHVEKLESLNGMPGYSRAHGENSTKNPTGKDMNDDAHCDKARRTGRTDRSPAPTSPFA